MQRSGNKAGEVVLA